MYSHAAECACIEVRILTDSLVSFGNVHAFCFEIDW